MIPADPGARRWTLVGLAIALFAGPAVIACFTFSGVPLTAGVVLLREGIVFALTVALLLLVRNKERLGWDSVGLRRPPLRETSLWVLITIVGVAVALALSFGIMKLFHWPFGSHDAAAFEALPRWVMGIVILRAGFVEELFYRGYALERMPLLTRSRLIAIGAPLLLFAVAHYRQGLAGITIALLTGAVLTAVYLIKRNLWIGVITHFLVDFIPNIILPLFVKDPG